jgi:hypothetical protein
MYALGLLRTFGADPTDPAVARAVDKVSELTHYEGGHRFFDGEVEACINARVVLAAIYFGYGYEGVVERLLDDQLTDGGWNCYAPRRFDRRFTARSTSWKHSSNTSGFRVPMPPWRTPEPEARHTCWIGVCCAPCRQGT